MKTYTPQLESLEYKTAIQEIAISFDKRARDIEGVLNSAIHKLELLRNTMAQDKIESLKEDILKSTTE